jgi:hypothetical protein
LQGKENSGTDYGSWVRGYLEAPANGNFIFFIASDDSSELWLSTNHLTGGSVRIAYESGSGAPLFTGARLSERQSAPVALVRGQKYYFEVRHKQGAGASYLQVGWQRPDGVQEIVPALHLAQHPLDAYLSRTTANLPPTFNTGGLNGGDLPTSTNVDELRSLLLQTDVIAAQPTTFQWLSNGVPIPGEDLSFLHWTNVPFSANGATLQAVVSNQFGTLLSATNILTVTPVVTPLGIALVDHRGNPNGLQVTFSKPVSPLTATNLANYSLSTNGGASLTITNAGLLPDAASVQLSGEFGFVPDGQYHLTIQDVEDQAAIPNGLSPNPTNVTFAFSGPYLGPIGFSTNSPLQSLSVLENRLAHFEVLLTGAQPWSFQWLHNGVLITNATNSVLEVPATAATAGDYRVEVSNEFSAATSPTVQLTGIPDLAPPKLVSIRGLAGGINEIELRFDEGLNAASATSLSIYTLGLTPILSATLTRDGSSVTLRTAGLVPNQVYLLTISGLQDRAVSANAFSGTAAFVAEVNYAGEVLADGAVRYWRLNETNDSRNLSSLISVRDALTSAVASPNNSPALEVAGLLPGEPHDAAIHFSATKTQYVSVHNGSDINASAGPWAKKSVELWFRADSVPAPGTTGLAAAAALWEQGGANRDLALYLWRDPANINSNEAALVFNVLNNIADGAGAPFGPPGNPAVLVQTNIQAGQVYHVIGVLDGDANGTNGNLILYVNGTEIARAGGAGQVYNHTGNVQLGHGNGRIHTGENGDLGYFDGTIDDVSLYNRALPAARVAAHYQAGAAISAGDTNPPVVSRVDTRGNPNQLLVTFSKPVTAATANNLENYSLHTSGGAALTLGAAQLLADERTVKLQGFTLASGASYTLGVSNLQTAPPDPLTLSPTNFVFTFAAPAGAGFSFDDGLSSEWQLFGNAGVLASGSHDGSGYLRLTGATNNQNGAILFNERRDVDEFHLHFKARLSDPGTNAADGFSVNFAADLPTGTFGTAEEGYQPLATITADRLVIAFDNYTSNSGDSSPSIALKWRGVVLTNVLTGTNGIPALHNTNGAWVDVDLKLDRGHKFTATYDAVTVISHSLTDFTGIKNAQLALGARTGGSYETHWFDDLSINYSPSNLGPVGIGPDSELSNVLAVENQIVRFTIVPTGAGPFACQWYREDAPIPGATDRALYLTATTNVTGHYHAVVWNEFSQATSAQATLSVDTDSTPPAVTRILGLAGTLNEIRVWLDEPLDELTATNLAHYSAGALPLLSAALSPDGQLVTLKTGPQVFQQSYTLQLAGLRDRSAAGNVLNTTVPFTATASYADEVLADQPVRYWRLDETNGVNVASLTSALDILATTPGTLVNSPLLGQPPLAPNAVGDGAIQFQSTNSNRITIRSGSDLNINTGPWEKKTVEFWFKALSVPAPGATGTGAAAGLYEQGAGTRGLSIYLWRDPANTNAAEADLVFNAWNNAAADGPGSPFGVPAAPTFVRTTISAAETYHIAAVFDGGTNLATGQLILYVNGVEAGRVGNVGQLYNHNSDIQIGRGNTLLHTATTTTAANLSFFEGVVDEFALYNTALSAERVAAHFQVANTVIASPTISSFRFEAGSPVIRWDGSARLQFSTNAAGPFVDVPGAVSLYVVKPDGLAGFFRLAQ